jgi:hypothetical protein
MTLRIITFFYYAECLYDESCVLFVVMLSVNLLSVKCLYADCHYAECRSLFIVMPNVVVLSVEIFYSYADCHYDEFRIAECHCAESHGATGLT